MIKIAAILILALLGLFNCTHDVTYVNDTLDSITNEQQILRGKLWSEKIDSTCKQSDIILDSTFITELNNTDYQRTFTNTNTYSTVNIHTSSITNTIINEMLLYSSADTTEDEMLQYISYQAQKTKLWEN